MYMYHARVAKNMFARKTGGIKKQEGPNVPAGRWRRE
jgi:hypothetical protein